MPPLALDTEQHLLLLYPNPYYFFVNKTNVDLKNFLTEGLERLVKNGKFDQLFYNNPQVQITFEKGGLDRRKVIRLENSTLPAEALETYNKYNQGHLIDFDALQKKEIPFQ
jgi:hypothetical protein